MPKSRCLTPLELLDKARKGWDYFISDEVVYEGKLSDIESPKKLPTWIDYYRSGDLWFEVVGHFPYPCGNQKHTLVLLLYANSGNSVVTTMESEMPRDDGWGDDSVFVPIRQILKVAEHYVIRPIPTVIRLKLFDLHMRSSREKANIIPVETADKGIARQTLTSQRKRDDGLLLGSQGFVHIGGVLDSERPSDIIKGCPQIRQNVPNNQGPIFLQFGLNGHLCNIADIVKFACFSNGNLWLQQAVNTPFESLDVYIRPLNLELGAIEWVHSKTIQRNEHIV